MVSAWHMYTFVSKELIQRGWQNAYIPFGLEYANSAFREASGTMLSVMRHIEHLGRGRPQCTQPVGYNKTARDQQR